MRITTFTDYAFRVLIQAALRYPEKTTIDEVANAFNISRNHLIKVIGELARAGFIVTQRGRSGGFTLSRPAGLIKVSDVMKFGEKGHPLVECFDPATNACVITPVCKLNSMLSESLYAFYEVLDRYTIADVCQNPDQLLRCLRLAPAK